MDALPETKNEQTEPVAEATNTATTDQITTPVDAHADTHIKLRCKIRDSKFVEYTEGLDEDVVTEPLNQIVLMIEDLDTQGVFGGSLSEQDIREITGMDHLLGTRELIDVAKWLRDCDLQFEFWVPRPEEAPRHPISNINRDLPPAVPLLLKNPGATSVGSQFRSKKKKNAGN